jgi:hypothetical protein
MGTIHPLSPPEGVQEAVRAAIGAMTWLGPADQGMVALALDYARRIDAADDDKAAGYLGQNLSGVLRALGGAPAERKALGVEEKVAGKLATLRARRPS